VNLDGYERLGSSMGDVFLMAVVGGQLYREYYSDRWKFNTLVKEEITYSELPLRLREGLELDPFHHRYNKEGRP